MGWLDLRLWSLGLLNRRSLNELNRSGDSVFQRNLRSPPGHLMRAPGLQRNMRDFSRTYGRVLRFALVGRGSPDQFEDPAICNRLPATQVQDFAASSFQECEVGLHDVVDKNIIASLRSIAK